MSRKANRPLIGIIAIATLIVAAAAVAIGVMGRSGKLETTVRDLGEFESVRLSCDSIAIEVSGTQGAPRLEATIDSRRSLSVTGTGGSLDVKVSRVLGLPGPSRQEVITLMVPAGAAAGIDSGSGSVEIADVDLSRLTVDTGSGSVSIRRSRAAIAIDVGSGGVKLSEVAGDLTITSGSGSIRGDSIKLTGNSLFDTGSGDIEISFLNSEDELAFDLDSGSGSIRVGGIQDADRVRFGTGNITVSGSSGSGNQVYQTR